MLRFALALALVAVVLACPAARSGPRCRGIAVRCSNARQCCSRTCVPSRFGKRCDWHPAVAPLRKIWMNLKSRRTTLVKRLARLRRCRALILSYGRQNDAYKHGHVPKWRKLYNKMRNRCPGCKSPRVRFRWVTRPRRCPTQRPVRYSPNNCPVWKCKCGKKSFFEEVAKRQTKKWNIRRLAAPVRRAHATYTRLIKTWTSYLRTSRRNLMVAQLGWRQCEKKLKETKANLAASKATYNKYRKGYYKARRTPCKKLKCKKYYTVTRVKKRNCPKLTTRVIKRNCKSRSQVCKACTPAPTRAPKKVVQQSQQQAAQTQLNFGDDFGDLGGEDW